MSEAIIEGEIWKAIPGFEGRYEISNLGRVKSLPRSGTKGGIRKLRSNQVYLRVYFHGTKGMASMVEKYIHRLVAEAFVPNPEDKPEVNHKNGIKSQNNAENLEWVTKSENILHSYRVLGRKPVKCRGSKSGRAKLTEQQIPEIRRFLKLGFTNARIGSMFGVSENTISFIKNRKSWTHVPV
jgi:hypothetical protein